MQMTKCLATVARLQFKQGCKMKNQFYKYMMLATLLAVAVPAQAFWGFSNSIQGSGVAKTETRPIAAYENIVVDGTVDVEIKTDAPVSLQITGDDNIVPLVQTEVKNGVLHISTQDGTSYSAKVNLVIHTTTPVLTSVKSNGTSDVTVQAVKLAEIEVTGTGQVIATGLNTPTLLVKSTGTSDVTLTGSTQKLVAKVSGTGALDAKNFKALDADVSVSGTGDAYVFVSGQFNANASGLGDIVYSGNPTIIEQNATGFGKIHHE